MAHSDWHFNKFSVDVGSKLSQLYETTRRCRGVVVTHADSQYKGCQLDSSMCQKSVISGNGKPPHKIHFPRKNSEHCLWFLLRWKSSMQCSSMRLYDHKKGDHLFPSRLRDLQQYNLTYRAVRSAEPLSTLFLSNCIATTASRWPWKC